MIVAFFIFFFFLVAPAKITASEPTVVLNEIYPPTTSDWVELYNNSSAEIDLGNWKLLDTATTPMKVLEEGEKISPKSFLVIEVSTRLNKSGDTIRLIDKDGVEVDSYKYSTSSENKSFARIPDGSGSWFGDQNPTKEAANGTNPPKDTKQNYPKISLSEIFPYPEKGGREWVELYNPNSFAVVLADWQLVDEAGHQKNLAGAIPAKSYQVFEYSSGWLNNGGDVVKLVDPSGKRVEQYAYTGSDKGSSLAKNAANKWLITSLTTPGKKNRFNRAQKEVETSSGQAPVNSSGIESTGLEPTLAYLGDTFDLAQTSNLANPHPQDKVAGISDQKRSVNPVSTLLFAAGIAFIGTALAWPFLEKRKIV